MTDPTYSVSDAARALNVTRQTIYRWLDEGRLAGVRDAAGKLRVIAESVRRCEGKRT